MEVEQQTDAQATHSKVGQNLRLMRRNDAGHSLDLNNNLPFHENVSAESFIKSDILIEDRNCDLPCEGDPSCLKFMAQATFIHGFQHPAACHPMYLDCQSDYPLSQFARNQHPNSPSRSVFLSALRVKGLTLTNLETPGFWRGDRQQFYRFSDTAIRQVLPEVSVAFLRVSGHLPADFASTWDPAGLGPFKQMAAEQVEDHRVHSG
ncbi:MAG TPA: hypothetical protein VFN42_04305 [Acetobacteraceae bacterium]|nr:hypothetical protein [Acetobacteraceae bacterium]